MSDFEPKIKSRFHGILFLEKDGLSFFLLHPHFLFHHFFLFHHNRVAIYFLRISRPTNTPIFY